MSQGKKYEIIYADPPWRYDFSKDSADKIEKHYPTMTVDEIKVLQVPSADNAVLYLWATAPKLLEALEVMKAWGFDYKTHAIWDKGSVGMGYWFRGQHELLLVGVKGKFSPPEAELRISSVIRQQKSIHSAKPDYVKEMIHEWFPCATKLEMFCRSNRVSLFQQDAKWEIWGNALPNSVEIIGSQLIS